MHWAQQKTVAGGSVFLARFTFLSSVAVSDFVFVAVETTALASDDGAETGAEAGAAAFRFFCALMVFIYMMLCACGMMCHRPRVRHNE